MSAKILVIEDVRLLAIDIVDRVTSWGYEPIGPFSSGEEAFVFIKKESIVIDMALLDIEIKGNYDGISLAVELNKLKPTPIIFLSKMEDEHTLKKVMSTGYSAFLNKPFSNNELKAAIYKALQEGDSFDLNLIENDPVQADRVYVKNPSGTSQNKVLIKDIIYIESSGETSRLYVANTSKPIVLGGNLGKILERIAFSNVILRTSRFHAVNIDQVKSISSNGPGLSKDHEKGKKYLVLEKTERLIPLSEKYKRQVTSRLKFL
ncbi:MAG: response regulator [Cyclobacteriaceae bacterium]